ncbi:hypothetical protein F4553_005636 [Allocatelliglobosispora scoriae]|uniref:Uncharacterized protein n=1 Tax=Allocatelliglobosispora scoriae TaxID=643052 RepID=A0A841BZH9_9ACTN|nr:hypothetical protein [Allocatelliglobosispora scoriae]
MELVRAEIGSLAETAIGGIFFDQVPTSPYSVGPVAVAVRAARRWGFDTVLINPGRPTDSLYRGLGATICTFEGSWTEYIDGTTEGVRPGDAHIVHSIPTDQLAACLELMRGRGAGWGLATTEGCLVPSPSLTAV